MAFRVGVLVEKMARCIEPWEFEAQNKEEKHSIIHGDIRTDVKREAVNGERPSWTFLMAGSGTEEALRDFVEDNNVSLTFSPQHMLLGLIPPLCEYANGNPLFILAVLYGTPMDQRPLNWRYCGCERPAEFSSSLRCMGTLEARTAEASTFADFRTVPCPASLQP